MSRPWTKDENPTPVHENWLKELKPHIVTEEAAARNEYRVNNRHKDGMRMTAVQRIKQINNISWTGYNDVLQAKKDLELNQVETRRSMYCPVRKKRVYKPDNQVYQSPEHVYDAPEQDQSFEAGHAGPVEDDGEVEVTLTEKEGCLLYTSPSPRD